MISSYGFPQLPRRKKKKHEKGGIFPHYIDYSRATVAAGDFTSPMGQGVSGHDVGPGSPPVGPTPGDGGGLGESIDDATLTAPAEVETTPDKIETSKDVKPEDKAHPYQFGCAMFMFPETQAFMVRYWAEKNIPEDALHINPDIGHDGFENEPHVTIKFGLHDMDTKKLEEVVDGFGPVDLCLGKIKKFDTNPDYDVLVIEVSSLRLMELNALICKYMEFTDTFKDYKPHATLAFVKKGSCDTLIGNDFFDGLDVCGEEITYSNKDGEEFKISLEVV